MDKTVSDLARLRRRQLRLMIQVRTYFENTPLPRSKFVSGVIDYFAANGRLTKKQERAITGWLEQEKNKLRFRGVPLPEVDTSSPSEASNRFKILIHENGNTLE